MTGKMQKETYNEISRCHWEYLSKLYISSGFEAIKPEAKLLGVNERHLVAKIKEFIHLNSQVIQFKKISSELDILKDLSFTERLQLALNYSNNYFEFSDNNNTLAE